VAAVGLVPRDLVATTTLGMPPTSDAYCQVHAKYLEQNRPHRVLEVAPKMVRPDFLVEVYAGAKKAKGPSEEKHT